MKGIWMRRFVLGVACLLPSVPAASQEANLSVRVGRYLDVERGEYRGPAVLRIKDGRIAAITGAEDTGPSEAIDLSGYTVLPGLIDVHTHLCDNSYMGDDFDHWSIPAAGFGAVGAINARKTLEAGFTTVRNVSEPFYAGVALRDAIAKGWVEGPRMYASGPMITMTGGHGHWGNWIAPDHGVDSPADLVVDGVDEMRRAVRTLIRYQVDWIKLSATGGFGTYGTIPGAASYTVDEIRAAVEEAAKHGIQVAAHAHGEEGILNALTAGARSIEHAFLMKESSLARMKEQGTFLVMDLLAAHYDLVETDKDYRDKRLHASNLEAYRAYEARFARAYDAGVKMAFGTDAGIYPHGRNAEQFPLMVAAGMKPIDAVRSATVWAAELLGLEADAGSIATGKWADLIAVEGDPLADVATLTNVRFVMREGRIIQPATPATKDSTRTEMK